MSTATITGTSTDIAIITGKRFPPTEEHKIVTKLTYLSEIMQNKTEFTQNDNYLSLFCFSY